MKLYLNSGPWDALLFDIDNTLYRDDTYIEAQLGAIMSRFAQREGMSTEEAIARIERTRQTVLSETGTRLTMSNVLVHLGVSIEESSVWRSEEIKPELWLKPDHDVQRLFASLKNKWTLVALTNNPAQIGQRSLRALGLDEFFLATIGLDTRYMSKPGWGPFEAALEAAGAEIGRTVMFGDRYEVDLEPFVTRGGSGVLIETLGDLQRIPSVLQGS